ncbi:MAG TPA: SDR family oxidoreductase [Nocardioides sp.]
MSVGRVVLVAGGTSGINRALARGYAAEGARVAVLSRSQEKVDDTVAELGTLGGGPGVDGVRGYAADVRDADAVAAAAADVAAAWGPIDVVVSGAAGNFVAPAAELSPGGFGAVVDIDLRGTFHVMRAVHPHLRRPGASIVNITAAQSWLPTPGQVHVSAAKAGIDQVTRTLAMEWGPEGIRVNSVAPGPVTGTEGMARLAPTPEAVEAWTRAVPLRRFADAADIWQAVRWLTSPESAYVTGVVLSVDGGLSLGGSSAIAAAMGAGTGLP